MIAPLHSHAPLTPESLQMCIIGRREGRTSQHASEEEISVVWFSGEMLERKRRGREIHLCHVFWILLCQSLRQNALYLPSSSSLLFSCHVVILLTPRTVNWCTQLTGSKIRGIAFTVRRDNAAIPDPFSADPYYYTGLLCSGLGC